MLRKPGRGPSADSRLVMGGKVDSWFAMGGRIAPDFVSGCGNGCRGREYNEVSICSCFICSCFKGDLGGDEALLDIVLSDPAKESCEQHDVVGERREESAANGDNEGLCLHSNLEALRRVRIELRESKVRMGNRKDGFMVLWVDAEVAMLGSCLETNTITSVFKRTTKLAMARRRGVTESMTGRNRRPRQGGCQSWGNNPSDSVFIKEGEFVSQRVPWLGARNIAEQVDVWLCQGVSMRVV